MVVVGNRLGGMFKKNGCFFLQRVVEGTKNPSQKYGKFEVTRKTSEILKTSYCGVHGI